MLAGGRCAAEVARPDDRQHLDGVHVTAVRGPLAPQRRQHCVGLHAIARHVAGGEARLGHWLRDRVRGVLLVDDLAQKGHPLCSVLLHAPGALQIAMRIAVALFDGLA